MHGTRKLHNKQPSPNALKTASPCTSEGSNHGTLLQNLREYLKVGVPLTLATILGGALWLTLAPY